MYGCIKVIIKIYSNICVSVSYKMWNNFEINLYPKLVIYGMDFITDVSFFFQNTVKEKIILFIHLHSNHSKVYISFI